MVSSINTLISIGSIVGATISPIQTNYPHIDKINYESTLGNTIEQSKSLDWKLSNEELILNSLLASYLSETFNYEIKKYSDDSNYYITVYDTSLDIDNNFELVKNLNEQSLTDDLPFIFVVGGE